MFRLAVVIVALALLFLLTSLALAARGRLGHPRRTLVLLVACLAAGAALLLE